MAAHEETKKVRMQRPDRLSPKHGHAREGRITRAYRCWTGMKQRCSNPNSPSYPDYGGRGLIVCPEWRGRHDFPTFYRDMGDPPPGKSLDRRNNNAGYSPENCRWATKSVQNYNRRKK